MCPKLRNVRATIRQAPKVTGSALLVVRLGARSPSRTLPRALITALRPQEQLLPVAVSATPGDARGRHQARHQGPKHADPSRIEGHDHNPTFARGTLLYAGHIFWTTGSSPFALAGLPRTKLRAKRDEDAACRSAEQHCDNFHRSHQPHSPPGISGVMALEHSG